MKSFLLVSLLALAACGGPSFESVCDRAGEECGLPAEEVAECKQFGQLATDAAEQTGCEGELDDYLACVDSSAEFCTQNFGDDCNAQEDALNDCGAVESQDDPPAPG